MQRSIRCHMRTSNLFRVFNLSCWTDQRSVSLNTNTLTLKRCFSNKTSTNIHINVSNQLKTKFVFTRYASSSNMLFNQHRSKSTAGKEPNASSQQDRFESKDNDNKETPSQTEHDIRSEILRESLKHVGQYGWTMDAIRAGIQTLNQSTTLEGLFDDGYDLIDFLNRDATLKMSVYMGEKNKKENSPGHQLLVDGLKYRLSLIVPYSNIWAQALVQGALPRNALRSFRNLIGLSSEAWYSIGDKSTDTNWYTKRLLLAAVYKSSEIYMIQDQSRDKMDTMLFLERCLNDFQTASSIRYTISKSLSDTTQLGNGLFAVIRNLTFRR